VVHYSTNYIFDGSAPHPYREEDPPAPLSVYGESKLLGELAIATEQPAHLILRTSAIYGRTGTNFVRRMLELAHEREELRVVNDQFVSPTPASAVAEATVRALAILLADPIQSAFGTYHLTTSGSTSWYDFGRAILARDPARDRQRCHVITPVSSAEFILPARRPANGLLDNGKFARRFGFAIDSWETELDRTIGELRTAN
jgi:dTDP-4-dehydrorhamnose reductase